MAERTKNYIFFIIIGLITFGFCYLLAPVLTPFLVAAILAYLTNPLVEKFTRFRIPRLLSVIIVFLLLFFLFTAVLLLLVPVIQKQIATLIAFIPEVVKWIQDQFIPWITAHVGFVEEANIEGLKTTLTSNWTKAGGVLAWLLTTVFHSSLTMIEWITNLILIPVVTFYLLRDWHRLLQYARDLLPRRVEPTIVELVKEGDEVLSAFFRGQLLVMLLLGMIYATGLTFVGLKLSVVIGIIAGLLSIVPYLGFIVGIVTASIAGFVQFGSFYSVLLIWLVFGVGQILESTVLTPLLVGDRIGLHPVAVIFAILAGGSLFGFFGILLALPVAAIIMVWLRFVHRRYRESELYKVC